MFRALLACAGVAAAAPCLAQDRSAVEIAFGFVYCTPLAKASIGSSWIGRAITGEVLLIKLLRGKVDPADG